MNRKKFITILLCSLLLCMPGCAPKEEPVLTEAQLQNIADVAYLVEMADCFYSTEEVPKKQLAKSIYIYYSLPLGGENELGEWVFDANASYPPDEQFDGNFVLYEENMHTFIKDIWGVELIEPLEHEDVRYRDGKYHSFLGDYEYRRLFVEEYAYVGDGRYFVSLGGDWAGLPGADDHEELVVHDCMRLVVQETDTPYGFTVVSKLKDDDEEPQELAMPEYVPEKWKKQ